MLKITLAGASGKACSHMLCEPSNRKHGVTAIGRSRKRSSLSALFVPRERMGIFRLGKGQLLRSETGSSISSEDHDMAVVDEIDPKRIRQRFLVGC